MSRPGRAREMTPAEQHDFTNALRDFLGLGPLYGTENESAVHYGDRRTKARAASTTDAADEVTARPAASAAHQPIQQQPEVLAHPAAQAAQRLPQVAAHSAGAAPSSIAASP